MAHCLLKAEQQAAILPLPTWLGVSSSLSTHPALPCIVHCLDAAPVAVPSQHRSLPHKASIQNTVKPSVVLPT